MLNLPYHFLVFPIMIALSLGNEPGYRLTIQLAAEQGANFTEELKSSTAAALASRFSDQQKYPEVLVGATADGLELSLFVRDTTKNTLDEISFAFNSVELTFYGAANAKDITMEFRLDTLTFPDGVDLVSLTRQFQQNSLAIATDNVDLSSIVPQLGKVLGNNSDYTFAWALPETMGNKRFRQLYIFRNPGNGLRSLTHEDVARAGILLNERGEEVIDLHFSEQGTEVFAQMTKEAAFGNNGTIGIVVNGELWSNPTVNGEITSGNIWLYTGSGQNKDLRAVARQLNWAPLPVDLREVSRIVSVVN